MLQEFSRDAVAVLDRIDRTAAAELELGIGAGAPGHDAFRDAVAGGDREAVRAALTGGPTPPARPAGSPKRPGWTSCWPSTRRTPP